MTYIDDNEGWGATTFAPDVVTYDKIGSRRRFGVELEYQTITDSWTNLEGETVFGAKEDCSVNGGEFVSPILYGDQGLACVDKFCQLAEANDFDAGIGAGYHLHLDMTKESMESLKQIALAYHYTKDLWLSMIPEVRRNYTYSENHSWTRQDLLSCQDNDGWRNFYQRQNRYHWMNVYAYHSHKTFEIRCHEGVNDSKSVNDWAIAHTRFADAMSETSVGRITRTLGSKKITELFRELRAIIRDDSVSEHLKQRNSRYN
jgi:hypothetical protein